tara:strand:- start:814 stop:918 length:105 start_codon:yes stop_codon:yes gene_type:complete
MLDDAMQRQKKVQDAREMHLGEAGTVGSMVKFIN